MAFGLEWHERSRGLGNEPGSGCAVQATVEFGWRGGRYRVAVVADVPYHVSEALRRYDDRFKGMPLDWWQRCELVGMCLPEERYARATVRWCEVLEEPVTGED